MKRKKARGNRERNVHINTMRRWRQVDGTRYVSSRCMENVVAALGKEITFRDIQPTTRKGKAGYSGTKEEAVVLH